MPLKIGLYHSYIHGYILLIFCNFQKQSWAPCCIEAPRRLRKCQGPRAKLQLLNWKIIIKRVHRKHNGYLWISLLLQIPSEYPLRGGFIRLKQQPQTAQVSGAVGVCQWVKSIQKWGTNGPTI